MLSLSQYTDIEHEFNINVIKERERYAEIYEIIEEYISKNNKYDSNLKYDSRIIMGDSASVHMLMDLDKTRNDYIYTLYSESAFPHANAISNLIAAYIEKNKKRLLNIYISLKTVLQNMKYIVYVDSRVMIYINNIRKMSDNIKAFDLIKPVEKQINNKTFYLLPPHFYLVNFYRTLYSPNYASHWQDILEKENVLYSNLKSTLKSLGGDTNVVGSKEDRLNIMKHIFDNFLANSGDIALIDESAINFYSGKKDIAYKYVIFCESSIKDFIDVIKKSIRILLNRDIMISYKIQNIDILNDYRLKRYIVKLEDKEILQIYNSAHYDLIPINKFKLDNGGFVNIANPFVVMRFLLVEIYIINVVLALKKIDEKFANRKLESIIGNVVKLRAGIKKVDIFQKSSDEYVGKFIDDINYEKYKREKMQQDRKISPDYYPQKYMIYNSEYRQIGFR